MTRSRRRARHATKTQIYDPESRPRMPFRPRCNQGTFDGGVQSEPTTRPRTAEMGAKELELQPIRAVLPACNAR